MNYHDTQQYLATFERRRELFTVEGNTRATTFGCSRAVILASALSGSKAADELSELTGLPINFAGGVLFAAEAVGLWEDRRWGQLLLELRIAEKRDLQGVDRALCSVIEQLWSRVYGKVGDFLTALETFRARSFFGGARESWVDPGNVCSITSSRSQPR